MTQPAPAPCPERQRLLESIKLSGERVATLHLDESEAVKKDDMVRLQRIWRDLDRAIALHDSLVEEFNDHLQAHGCRPPTAVE